MYYEEKVRDLEKLKSNGFFFYILYFTCVGVGPTCVHKHHMSVCSPCTSEEGTGFPGAGITENCHTGAGSQARVSARTRSALNH